MNHNQTVQYNYSLTNGHLTKIKSFRHTFGDKNVQRFHMDQIDKISSVKG